MPGVLRVLSIEVTHRGFAFVVLEGPERLIDWNARDIEGNTSSFLFALDGVIDRYRPDVLVLEEPAGSRKRKEAKRWLAWSEQLADERSLRSLALPALGRSKDQIAEELASLFPELAPRLPKPRKPWNGEVRGIAKFVALERGLRASTQLEAEQRAG